MQQTVRVFRTDFSYSAGNKAAPMQDVLQDHVSALNREGLKVVSFHWPENSDRTKFIAFLCERI